MWYRMAKKKSYDNVMIAFYLPKSIANAMVVKPKDIPDDIEIDLSPAEDMHMTLVLLDDAKELEPKTQLVQSCLEQIASEYGPISGKIGGVGAFMPGTEVSPIYYSFDAPGLPNFQIELKNRLKNIGLPVNEEHGFTPHITIGYAKNNANPIETLSHIDLSPTDVKFSEIQLRWGNIEKGRYKLTGKA